MGAGNSLKRWGSMEHCCSSCIGIIYFTNGSCVQGCAEVVRTKLCELVDCGSAVSALDTGQFMEWYGSQRRIVCCLHPSYPANVSADILDNTITSIGNRIPFWRNHCTGEFSSIQGPKRCLGRACLCNLCYGPCLRSNLCQRIIGRDTGKTGPRWCISHCRGSGHQ